MRILAYCVVLSGLMLLANAAWDDHRGIATAATPSQTGMPNVEKRSEHPQHFRNLMTYQWGRAGFVIIARAVLLGFVRRADQLDPFSPDFSGNSSLNDLGRTLDAEAQKRHRPLR